MSTPIQTVAVVVFDGTKVLLVKHKENSGHITDTYGLPAGRIEEKETEEVAAKRELQEETGLDSIRLIRLSTEYSAVLQRKGGEKEFHMVAFLCNGYVGKIRSSPETEPEWVEIEALNELNLIPNVHSVVSEAWEFK